MDNASKALVMVGAILIAVMLISLGVFLFTYARDNAESTTKMMDATMVSSFNEQFLSFCGTNIKGSSVVSLISKVKASNTQNPDFPVSINKTSAAQIDRSATYVVTETYDPNDGHISQLTVSP